MSILDCVRPFNGLIKQCFAWLIEASSQVKIPRFFLLRAAKVHHVGRINNSKSGNMPIIKLICLAGPCVIEYYLVNDDQQVMFQWVSKEVYVQNNLTVGPESYLSKTDNL